MTEASTQDVVGGAAGPGKQLLMVFSSTPAGVSADEYFDWYEAHLDELLEIPCFTGAQRFLVQELGSDVSPERHSHLAIYEVDVVDDLLAEMAKMGLSTQESYVQKKATDPSGPPLPAWWDRTAFVAWTCAPLGPWHTPRA